MWAEYWRRSEFVALHGALLAAYVICLFWSTLALLRERRALNVLELQGHQGITEALQGKKFLRKSVLAAEATGLTNPSAAQGVEREQTTIDLVLRGLSGADDIIRFCVNGFVVVGLMGTLSAFYRMWQNYGSASTPDPFASAPPNAVYLEGMATALVVSFVGLILALGTNALFSFVKTGRASFLRSLSRFLRQLGKTPPRDSLETSLLKQLTEPLNLLVEKLAVQNQELIQNLAVTVNQRTEQVDATIKEAVSGWQSLNQDFRKEALAAVGDLKDASSRLAKSSYDVSLTLIEVSKGLERTKDIGKIITRLESTSEEIIAKIGEKLQDATSGWSGTLTSCLLEHTSAITQLDKRSDDLATKISDRFDAAANTWSGTVSIYIQEHTSAITQLNKRADDMVAQIGEKLDGVADAWSHTLSGSIQEHTDAMATQCEAIERIVSNLTAETTSGFSTVSNSLKTDLESLKSKFVSETDLMAGKWRTDTDAIASKWMTAISGGSDQLTDGMRAIIGGWQESLNATTASIQTALNGSSDHLSEITGKLSALNSEIGTLHRLILELEEKAGAPIHLSRTVEELARTADQIGNASSELTRVRESLAGLGSSLSQNEILSDAVAAIKSNSIAVTTLRDSLIGTAPDTDLEKELIGSIDKLRAGVSEGIQSVQNQIKQLGTTNERAEKESARALGELRNNLSALQEHVSNQGIAKKIYRGFKRLSRSSG